jgi:hypothetical protein
MKLFTSGKAFFLFTCGFVRSSFSHVLFPSAKPYLLTVVSIC